MPCTNTSGVIATSHIVARHITKRLLSFRQILQFRFRENHKEVSPENTGQNKAISVNGPWDPSATKVSVATLWGSHQKFTFSTTSVLLLLNVPLSRSRETFLRLQKVPESQSQNIWHFIRMQRTRKVNVTILCPGMLCCIRAGGHYQQWKESMILTHWTTLAHYCLTDGL